MSTRSSVTISLVSEARGGPFVFWDDLPLACRKAKELGFDAIELFPPGPDAVDPSELRGMLSDHGLGLAAVGTGAGWVKRKLHLVLPNAEDRAKALAFIKATIDFAGPLGAPAIIGSMQGRSGGDGLDHATARGLLTDALQELGEHAEQYGVPLIYEPLNRYETNMANTLEGGAQLLDALSTKNVVLLADLFHMNIEEADIAASFLAHGARVGHIHFVDSNRRPVGFGHIEYAPIVAALNTIGYDRYISAEAFPYPDSDSAAEQTIKAYRQYFPR